MRKIKIFIMLFMILILSGCTVEYNIDFKINHKMNEEIIITEKKEFFDKVNYSASEVVEGKLYSYDNIIRKNKFSTKTNIKDGNAEVTLSSNNKSVNEFASFVLFQNLFIGVKVDENKETYSLTTTGYNNDIFVDSEDISDGVSVDKININIKFENKVLETNADKVDKKNNIYTWTVDKDTKDKSIYFKLENVDKQKTKNNKKENIQFDFKKIVMIGIILIIIVGIIYLSKKNN